MAGTSDPAPFSEFIGSDKDLNHILSTFDDSEHEMLTSAIHIMLTCQMLNQFSNLTKMNSSSSL